MGTAFQIMAIVREYAAPRETVNDDVVTITRLAVPPNVLVAKGDVVLEIETSKTAMTIEADDAGYVEFRVASGDIVPIGETLFSIHDAPVEATAPRVPTLSGEVPAAEPTFSNGALELLATHGIDRTRFAGSDFVTADDVRALVASPGPAAVPAPAAAIPPARSERADVTYKPLPSSKLTEIRYLSAVASAHLTSSVNVVLDTRGIFAGTKRTLAVLRTSLLPLTLFEVARLLRKFPEFNAFVDGERAAYYSGVHVGFAVDLGKGLRVVTIPDADKASLQTIEARILDLVERYENDTLTASDITGSTFTITDLSNEGVASFVPLVNRDQSAILGISTIDERTQTAVLTLTFDHRLTAAKPVARFLNELRERLESYRGDIAASAADVACDRCLKDLREDSTMGGRGFARIVDLKRGDIYLCGTCWVGF
ncbi:MAG: dihydrolipoamide acetyltransferase family protein [Candidatus Velthaea sp.]